MAANLSIATGIAGLVLALLVAEVSRREGESGAARRALLLAAILPLPYVGVAAIDLTLGTNVAAWLLGATLLVALALVVPTGVPRVEMPGPPRGRSDERDIMFARAHLEPGTARFDEYYRRVPENRPADDAFRARPGLLADGASLHDPYTFGAARSTFSAVTSLRPLVDGPVASETVVTDPDRMTRFLKEWLSSLGAITVGVAPMQEYHWYTHAGRDEDYGQPIETRHAFGVAFTVEMDKQRVDRAPFGPTAMESAQQYLNAGGMAVQVAAFVRGLGYPARAHIDGRYRVICPLVARDAGLGELGRMGLLMTPELGPRVRLGVVTTDLPLTADGPRPDPTVVDFCNVCKKCADMCPPNAIPFEGRLETGGSLRWRIDPDACFSYWCKVGTDCGWCMRVCPYSHPRGLMHDLVRSGIRNNSLFRRAAVRFDDALYGRRPRQVDLVDWMRLRPGPPGRN